MAKRRVATGDKLLTWSKDVRRVTSVTKARAYAGRASVSLRYLAWDDDYGLWRAI